MALRIEDYALIGDMRTAALVGNNGSIDWLCLPRFDSAACMAALLGDDQNGCWSIRPVDEVHRVTRAYRPDTLVLDTTFECATGTVRLTDLMLLGHIHPRVLRIVEGLAGSVALRMQLIVRFDYGANIPWVRSIDGEVVAVAGPDALILNAGVPTRGEGFTTVADFHLKEGEQAVFELVYGLSFEPRPRHIVPADELSKTESAWREWSATCSYRGEWRDAVVRSLITLKALSFGPTGGIVAAPTTSLPEQLGGVRNWDYRYCWLRDATFVLLALHNCGYDKEAEAWRTWLLRAVAGAPKDLQIVYGLQGERRLTEFEVPWLSGYEHARPVRVGNGAASQFQLDVYGEVIDALFQARAQEWVPHDADVWSMSHEVIGAIEDRWQSPDHGLWEVRGGVQHFTHSKVMAWVALDRAVKAVEGFGLDGPLDRWRRLRQEIHDSVCRYGYDPKRRTFTQYYGSAELDASCLLIPLVGFLPAGDPRVIGTVAAIERELVDGGFAYRYSQGGRHAVDGLPAGEGAFLACNFWLADNYVVGGRLEEARALFERIVGIANDVGLLAEEYEPVDKRLVGNFPQAFSHVGLVNTACNIGNRLGPAQQRGDAASKSSPA